MHLGPLSWCSKRKLTLPRGSWVEEDVSHEGCKVMPKVLNIRDCGYVIPEGAVYIGRAVPRYNLARSPYANMFRFPTQLCPTREDAIALYRIHCTVGEGRFLPFHEARGLDVVCWGAPEACHGAVVLELANPGGV